MEGGNDEIDADVVVASLMKLPDKFGFGRIVENDGRRLDIFGNVIEPPAADDLAVAEDTLAAGYLGMEKLGPNRITFAFSAKGPANGCQQNIRCDDDLLLIMMAPAGFEGALP
jgi:hypothetical protein